jgi:hypothetical protein
MATGQWLNLLDVASRSDANGKQSYIAEMMSQANEFLEYIPWIESSEMGGHEFVFRTSIPAGSWRQINQGVPYSKSTTARARIGVGALEDFSQVDLLLAEDSGDPATFRKNEDVAFLEGMGQTIIQTFWYGNTAATPAEFMGFSTFYNTVNTTAASTAANVIDGGGVGSSNTSIWLVGFGERTIHGVYPRGSKAGLDMKDFGDTQRGYDSLGNPFIALTSWFRQQAALCPQDWRYGVRIANLDVTNAGLAGPNAPDLFALLAEAAYLPPTLGRATSGITKTDAPNDPSPGIRPVIFTNRTGRHWMDVQSIRDRNVLLRPDESAGVVNETWRGVPVAVVDQLSTAEARVV